MCTPRPPSNWPLPSPKKWTVSFSTVTEVGKGDEIYFRFDSGVLSILRIDCPSSHSPRHSRTGWAGTQCLPVSAKRAEGNTLHTSPVPVAIESTCRDEPGPPAVTVHTLTCSLDSGNPGGGVCWIAEDG